MSDFGDGNTAENCTFSYSTEAQLINERRLREEAERQLADANAHVAALTAALETRRSACNEESERAEEAERQLAEARAALENIVEAASMSAGWALFADYPRCR